MATAPQPLDAINALSAEEVQTRLSGPPEQVAAFVREAAEGGSAEAQAVYGQMLLDGYGVRADERTAVRWFAAAAKQGHRVAINMIGRCYDLGWGVAVDKARAAECFRSAAQRGLDWGMYNYATALALGQGVAQDRAQALIWLRKAAELGNAKAINFIGSFHEDGWVVDRDMEAAADYYRRAAEGGDFRGQFNHARMLISASRTQDAQPWLKRSAKGCTQRFAVQAANWLRDNGLAAEASLFESAQA